MAEKDPTAFRTKTWWLKYCQILNTFQPVADISRRKICPTQWWSPSTIMNCGRNNFNLSWQPLWVYVQTWLFDPTFFRNYSDVRLELIRSVVYIYSVCSEPNLALHCVPFSARWCIGCQRFHPQLLQYCDPLVGSCAGGPLEDDGEDWWRPCAQRMAIRAWKRRRLRWRRLLCDAIWWCGHSCRSTSIVDS